MRVTWYSVPHSEQTKNTSRPATSSGSRRSVGRVPERPRRNDTPANRMTRKKTTAPSHMTHVETASTRPAYEVARDRGGYPGAVTPPGPAPAHDSIGDAVRAHIPAGGDRRRGVRRLRRRRGAARRRERGCRTRLVMAILFVKRGDGRPVGRLHHAAALVHGGLGDAAPGGRPGGHRPASGAVQPAARRSRGSTTTDWCMRSGSARPRSHAGRRCGATRRPRSPLPGW